MKRRTIDSPTGRLMLAVQASRLCEIRLAQADETFDDRDPILDEVQRQLQQYFDGKRRDFDIPLYMNGTEFECAVWQQLLQIPFGQIRTYGQIAAALSQPKASRAVGGACSHNPLLIVVPCHRVIAGTGKLTGFAAGMQMKRDLLRLEGWHIQRDCVRIEE